MAEQIMRKELNARETSPGPERAVELPTSPVARVPAGERIYAIGDIHGRLDLLSDLIARIRSDSERRGAARVRILLLGDLIDRGPHSAEIVALCRALTKGTHGFIVLKGNHELMMTDALGGNSSAFVVWLRSGGDATLRSWGVAEKLLDLGASDILLMEAKRRVPAEVVSWLNTRPVSLKVGDYLFVHAGIRPGVSLAKQTAADMLWIRRDFLDSMEEHSVVVIHGHSVEEEVTVRPNRIGIDTGAYRTGVLSAIGLEGEKRWTLSTDARTDGMDQALRRGSHIEDVESRAHATSRMLVDSIKRDVAEVVKGGSAATYIGSVKRARIAQLAAFPSFAAVLIVAYSLAVTMLMRSGDDAPVSRSGSNGVESVTSGGLEVQPADQEPLRPIVPDPTARDGLSERFAETVPPSAAPFDVGPNTTSAAANDVAVRSAVRFAPHHRAGQPRGGSRRAEASRETEVALRVPSGSVPEQATTRSDVAQSAANRASEIVAPRATELASISPRDEQEVRSQPQPMEQREEHADSRIKRQRSLDAIRLLRRQ